MERCLIIDGHNLLFRMFYGIPGTIKNSKGEDIKAVVGFVSGLIKYINKFSPNHAVVVFDSETSIASKCDVYEEYKSNRINYLDVPDNENPFTQLPYIFKVLDQLNIQYKEAQEYEADDYIASICHKYRAQYEIIVVSTDQDFYQLVNDNIFLFNPCRKDGIMYTAERIYQKLGVLPSQIVEYKAIVGDKSDNINGIKGIGPKTAQKILSLGNINTVIEKHLLDDKLSNMLKEKLDLIDRNIKLITMKKDIPIVNESFALRDKIKLNKKPMEIIKESGVY